MVVNESRMQDERRGRKRSDMASQRGRTAPFDFPSPRLPHWRRSDMRAK